MSVMFILLCVAVSFLAHSVWNIGNLVFCTVMCVLDLAFDPIRSDLVARKFNYLILCSYGTEK